MEEYVHRTWMFPLSAKEKSVIIVKWKSGKVQN